MLSPKRLSYRRTCSIFSVYYTVTPRGELVPFNVDFRKMVLTET